MATTDSARYTLDVSRMPGSTRSLAELLLGFAAIMAVLWLPTHEQLIFGPIALLAPLLLVLLRRPCLNDLGLGWRGFASSLWIFPAAVLLSVASVQLARNVGTFHSAVRTRFLPRRWIRPLDLVSAIPFAGLFRSPARHIFIGQHGNHCRSRSFLSRASSQPSTRAGNPGLGAVSCLLFRRYRNLYILGLTQGLLGLCLAICVPDAWHHHMRVGLGYLRYHPVP